jgi:hypothetical protein
MHHLSHRSIVPALPFPFLSFSNSRFFGGDSYILLYSYTKANSRSEEHIIYFWLGNDSSADEKGTAALLTVELDGE